jgi:hypothetical protein
MSGTEQGIGEYLVSFDRGDFFVLFDKITDLCRMMR